MKTIGLLGGMSWESSIEYYRIINERARDRLGGLHSARCIMLSVDFAEIEALQRQGQWQVAADVLVRAAQSLEKGGAEFVLICTNTMHKVADQVQAGIRIPLFHIADATAQCIKAHGLKKVGLLGTKFTMEEGFYKDRLTERHGLEVIVPEDPEREVVNRVIYQELVLGKIEAVSKAHYKRIMDGLVQAGAQGIILGCTEISLLVGPEAGAVPLFDTTRIHAEAAVDYALGGG